MIGGTSAEATLKTVKEASTGNLEFASYFREMMEVRHFGVWNGRQKFKKYARRVVSALSLGVNILVPRCARYPPAEDTPPRAR
ncbi:MAG: hypothetical protein U5K79_03240 [Cyclobacteriaceae bacterium]|nr:hypothetical protein [Cyclobacteriaceae bacterium]